MVWPVLILLCPGHWHAEIPKRADIAITAFLHSVTGDGLSDLDLSCIPPPGSPWGAIQIGAHTWLRKPASGRTT